MHPSLIVVCLVLVSAISATCVSAQTTEPQEPREPPVSLYGVVPTDSASVSGAAAAEHVRPAAVDRTEKAKRGEFVIAPLPMINPTLENGFSLVAGYLHRLDVNDRKTPPSVSALAGFKTSNGSWAASVLQTLNLAHDRFRVLAVAAYSDINYEFFGIGQSAGSAGTSIELNQAGSVGLFEGLMRIAPNWYVGARYQILDMTASTSDLAIPGGPTLPAIDADLRTASLGPRLEFDSRDNPFYPRRGLQVQAIANFHGEAVGGQRNYQVYEGWINGYHAVGARHVVAWHAGACGTDGRVPFYDLCLLGKNLVATFPMLRDELAKARHG